MPNYLLSLAVVLTAGIVGGEIAARLKLPKVTGWIVTGIGLRVLAAPGLHPEDLPRYRPFTDFVLGYIAFTVGSALHFAALRNALKRLGLLMVFEATITPALVAGALLLVGVPLEGALLLAAVAVAAAPGTTVVVVREARARGVFVSTLVAAVALIDVVAVSVFAFLLALLEQGGGGLGTLTGALSASAVVFGTAAAIGVGVGLAALGLARTIVGPAFLGPLMVAVILGSWGIAKASGTSAILAATFAGMVITNVRHDTARVVEAFLHPVGGVLFAGFYTLAGMRLDFSTVVPMAGIVVTFFIARFAGKSFSSYASMTITRMPSEVRRYLGLALLPHGGVAVGLVLLVTAEPALAASHDIVAGVGLAALAINQLLGPSATRFALHRAGEAGLDRPRLLDFLEEQHIVVDLKGKSKREIVRILVERLCATADIGVSREELVERVLAREAEESTCLGEGFMIPHAMLLDGERVRGVLGISSEGLDLDAPDGRLVHAVVLLATPESEHQRHLEILSAFALAITRTPSFREQLYHARTPAQAYRILHADDAEHFNYFLDETMAPSRSPR